MRKVGHYVVDSGLGRIFPLVSASVILLCLLLSWKTSFVPGMAGQCLTQAKDFVHLLHDMASPIIHWSLVILCAVNGPTNPLTILAFSPP